MRIVVAGLIGLSLLTAAAPASASQGRWGLTSDGDPELAVSPAYLQLHPPGDPQWRECPPGEGCHSIGGGTQPIRPGATAAGTVFESDLTDAGGTTTERSPVWQGRVHADAPPAVAGALVAGGTVDVAPARWSGGWG